MSYRALYLSNDLEFSARVAELDDLPAGDQDAHTQRHQGVGTVCHLVLHGMHAE